MAERGVEEGGVAEEEERVGGAETKVGGAGTKVGGDSEVVVVVVVVATTGEPPTWKTPKIFQISQELLLLLQLSSSGEEREWVCYK